MCGYLLFVIALFFIVPINLYAYPDGWSDDILLTPGDDKPRLTPDIDVDAFNNVWVVWDTTTWAQGTGEILYSKRDSLGNCLIPEAAVSSNPSFSRYARIVVDSSNNVHFVWRDETPLGTGLWHAKLENDGSMLVQPHVAVNGTGGIAIDQEVVLDRYQNTNAVWLEAPSGYNQASYTKLDSLGDPIIAKIRASPAGLNTYWPGIGTDSLSNIHMAYRTDTNGAPYRLTYSKLDNNGTILIANKVLGFGLHPTIIGDRNQNIHMVYCELTGYVILIRYLKLNQNGDILIGPKTISTPEINSNTYCHMAMDSLQYLHVVWQGDSQAIVHIMYCKLDTMGDYVIEPMKIVYPYQGGEPRIAVDRSNRLHVVWVDGRLNPGVTTDIFYKRGENEQSINERILNKPDRQCWITISPNPFCDATQIQFSFSRENEKTRIEIFDVLGRKVMSIVPNKSAGSIIWDGTDDEGNLLPAGVYLLRWRTDDGILLQKLIKMHK